MDGRTNAVPRPPRRKTSDWVGQQFLWLCGGALALNVLLVIGLLGLLAVNGLACFWQRPLVELTLSDGRRLLGEIHEREPLPTSAAGAGATPMRLKLKVGNRKLGGEDFLWIDESEITRHELPADAIVLERTEWGNFYGFAVALRNKAGTITRTPEDLWSALERMHADKQRQRDAIHALENGPIADINEHLERLRLASRRLALSQIGERERAWRTQDIEEQRQHWQVAYERHTSELFRMREAMLAEDLIAETADGTRTRIPIGGIVRMLRPNRMGKAARVRLYLSRLWEFVAGAPRESNTEGGVFPALFGTVTMVLIMAFAATPLGVLGALYLREYATQGPLVRCVRVAVNNLAGVPSIVFGVFGLGFFVYLVGGTIDQLFYPEALPTPTYGTGGILWASLTLALLTVPVVIVATEEGLAAVPRSVREGSFALGATKAETVWRVVIPGCAPAILTGMILAMARAAGEVAPLMIVGMVKLAPALPMDHHFPFIHLERKFMHLGFHIFDLGFQSPNVDATTPLVFATALLLVAVVTAMNLTAIFARNHLRRRYSTAPF